jgi:hypothetical protein
LPLAFLGTPVAKGGFMQPNLPGKGPGSLQ